MNNYDYKREDDVRYVEWLKKYGQAHTGAHKAHKAHRASTLDANVVKAFKATHSLRETAKHFNVSTTTISKLIK